MSILIYFMYPTKNSWGEAVYSLTFLGVILVVAMILLLLGLALFLTKRTPGTSKSAIMKQLTFSGAAMALGIITSQVLPSISLFATGGSITLFSMFFIVLIGYLFGFKAGITSAISYGMLQFILDPKFYSIPQMIFDYPLAFGALGLSGLFAARKHGLILGYLTGVIGRYIFAVISGMLFFASYAPEDTPVLLYSLSYNASYLIPEAVITLILLAIPAVSKGVLQVKKMAIS